MQQSELVKQFRQAYTEPNKLKERYLNIINASNALSKNYHKFYNKNIEASRKDYSLSDIESAISKLEEMGPELNTLQAKYHKLVEALPEAEKAERKSKTKMIIFLIVIAWILYLVL